MWRQSVRAHLRKSREGWGALEIIWAEAQRREKAGGVKPPLQAEPWSALGTMGENGCLAAEARGVGWRVGSSLPVLDWEEIIGER